MQYIILDMEALGDRKYDDFQEIIEIAAYRVKKANHISNHQYNREEKKSQFQIIDTFHTYIKPVFHTNMSKKIAKLTNISFDKIKNGCYFYEAMDQFSDWIGKEDFQLICWSQNDKHMLLENAREHFVQVEWLTDYYVDLQQVYDKKYMLRKQTSLSKALDNQGIIFEGKPHQAMDDAYNTFLLFRRL